MCRSSSTCRCLQKHFCRLVMSRVLKSSSLIARFGAITRTRPSAIPKRENGCHSGLAAAHRDLNQGLLTAALKKGTQP